MRLMVSDMDVLHAVVIAGLGIALLPAFRCVEDLRARRLERVLRRLERSVDAGSRGVSEHPAPLSQGEELRRPPARAHDAAAVGARTHAVIARFAQQHRMPGPPPRNLGFVTCRAPLAVAQDQNDGFHGCFSSDGRDVTRLVSFAREIGMKAPSREGGTQVTSRAEGR